MCVEVKIGADGRLVIDEESLIVAKETTNESVWETVEEVNLSLTHCYCYSSLPLLLCFLFVALFSLSKHDIIVRLCNCRIECPEK